MACGSPESLKSFFSKLTSVSAKHGLHINEAKCELWGEDPLVADESSLASVPVVPWADGVYILGTPVGSQRFSIAAVDRTIDKLKDALSKLQLLGDTRSAYLILQSSLGAARIIHILRSFSFKIGLHVAKKVHDLVFDALSVVIGEQLAESSVTLSSLPLKSGGLGIHDPLHILGPAGIASRLKACFDNVVDFPYSVFPDDFESYFSRAQGGLEDLYDWWK